jgi:hypothetical protein
LNSVYSRFQICTVFWAKLNFFCFCTNFLSMDNLPWAYFIRFGKRNHYVEEFFSIRAFFRREKGSNWKNFFYKVVSFCNTNKISPKKTSTFFEASYPFLLATYGIWGKYWFSDGETNFFFACYFHFLGLSMTKKHDLGE